MPLSLVHRVPSTARSLFTLDEDEHLIPASRSFDRKIGACMPQRARTLVQNPGRSATHTFEPCLGQTP